MRALLRTPARGCHRRLGSVPWIGVPCAGERVGLSGAQPSSPSGTAGGLRVLLWIDELFRGKKYFIFFFW